MKTLKQFYQKYYELTNVEMKEFWKDISSVLIKWLEQKCQDEIDNRTFPEIRCLNELLEELRKNET